MSAARVVAAIAALGLAGGAADAQQAPQRCAIIVDEAERAELVRGPTGAYNTFVGGGFVARCAGQPITLTADSAEYYEAQGLVYLIGNVRYREPRVDLASNRLTYFVPEERLVAEGNVVATLPSGTVLRGPRVDYFRAVAGVRDRSRLVAPSRPTVELVQRDSLGRPQPPVTIVANTIVSEADSLVTATGNVIIRRPDLVATAGTAFLDSGREYARLRESPEIRGTGDEPYTLVGNEIELFSRQRQLTRVLALGAARAASDEVNLRSDTIDMRLDAGVLQRAFAWGPSRALAISATSELLADSLLVDMPGQRLREIHAVGAAVAETSPDTLEIRSEMKDWIGGDTVVARFDTTVADTAGRPPLREVTARGAARSLYQIAAEEAARPAINYVRGTEITVVLLDQQVQRVRVSGDAEGIYLDPVASPPEPEADTTARQPAAQSPPPATTPRRRP